jgi:hypothetical protein
MRFLPEEKAASTKPMSEAPIGPPRMPPADPTREIGTHVPPPSSSIQRRMVWSMLELSRHGGDPPPPPPPPLFSRLRQQPPIAAATIAILHKINSSGAIGGAPFFVLVELEFLRLFLRRLSMYSITRVIL